MSRPVSLKSGGKPKQGPRHQNKTAFRHNKNSKKTERILSIPITNVCERCYDQLQWRKDYRKYKPLTQPKRWYVNDLFNFPATVFYIDMCIRHSNRCDQKTVKQAYHIICKECVLKYQCCGKCLDKLDPSQLEGGPGGQATDEGYTLEYLLETKPPGMKERERRRLIRELSSTEEKGGSDDKESIEEYDSDEEMDDVPEDGDHESGVASGEGFAD